jgi:hypothetical protein
VALVIAQELSWPCVELTLQREHQASIPQMRRASLFRPRLSLDGRTDGQNCRIDLQECCFRQAQPDQCRLLGPRCPRRAQSRSSQSRRHSVISKFTLAQVSSTVDWHAFRNSAWGTTLSFRIRSRSAVSLAKCWLSRCSSAYARTRRSCPWRFRSLATPHERLPGFDSQVRRHVALARLHRRVK